MSKPVMTENVVLLFSFSGISRKIVNTQYKCVKKMTEKWKGNFYSVLNLVSRKEKPRKSKNQRVNGRKNERKSGKGIRFRRSKCLISLT